jgi:hypothetical protein
MVIIRLGSALTRAQDDPLFRISLSYGAVIIYLIQYVVCQEKYGAVLQFTSHLLQIQISPFFYEKNGINRIKKASTVGTYAITLSHQTAACKKKAGPVYMIRPCLLN